MSNPNQDPFDALLRAAVVVDKNNEEIETPKVDNTTTTTTTIASRARSDRKNNNNDKKRQASTPYEEQQDVYGDDDTLIDTGRDVDLAPEGGTYDSHLTQRENTPKRRRRSRSTKEQSKLFSTLDIQVEDIDKDDKDEEDGGGGDEDEAEQQPANNEEEGEDDTGGKAINSTSAAARRRGSQVLADAQRLLDSHHQIESMLPTKQASPLCNPNHLCYMNTGLQTLAHMHCISKCFLNSGFMTDLNDGNFDQHGIVALAFHTILRRIMSSERRQRQGINAKEFKKSVDFCTRNFPAGQQDVMEFLTYLIRTLHQSTVDITGRSKISDLFSGDIVSTTVCPEPDCQHEQERTDPIWNLDVEIDPAAKGRDDSLQLCLHKMCEPETLNEENKLTCQGCGRSVQSTKSIKFIPSPILMITFKRFIDIQRKDGSWLGFPMTLDMTEFSTSTGRRRRRRDDLLYDLFAVINHEGTTVRRGHYFLYIKIDDVWNVYNDGAPISQITESQVVTDKAYALVYVKQSEFNRLIPSPATQRIVGTIRPPRPPSASSQPPKKAVATRQKKTPANINTSASQQKKKRSSSNTTADKSSTASTRKKRTTTKKRASDSNTTAAPKRKKSRTQPQWKRFQQIDNDKKSDDDQVPYFNLPLPDDMEIGERTNTKFGKTIAKTYYCLNKLCTKRKSGVGEGVEKELCMGCATRIKKYRRELEFDKEFQFQLVDNFDEKLRRINAKVHDSYPDDYKGLKQQVENGYQCLFRNKNIPFGLRTAVPSDSALVRQCLCVLFNLDNDVNVCFRSPTEDYLGKREKESEVSDAPSVKEFFQELAFWLFDKLYDKYKKDEDLKNRLRTILGYLEDPAQLHKLWEGDEFEYQDISRDEVLFDIRGQLECLNSIYNEKGHIRSTFYNMYHEDEVSQRKAEIAAIDTILKAFERDVEHHSRDKSSSWVNRDKDVKEFLNWLKLRRDILCQNSRAARRSENRFNAQVQESINKIDRKRDDAKTSREQNGTLHPAVAYIANRIQPPDYVTYMRTIRNELEQQQNQFNQDIKELQKTAFYKLLKDAQNNNQGDQPQSDDVSLRKIELAYHHENHTNRWFQDKFNGIRWNGVCSFTNDEYANAGKHRPELIGELYRRILVRLAKECMMKGCSIKPSDYDRAKQLFAFHLHHLEKGQVISELRNDINQMSKEAKKNCVVFCAGCHNQKEHDNVYSIPLNKLQNQLIYDEGNEHISGRELVLDFDLVVVVLKLFVMGGGRCGSTTRCTPNVLRSIFFDHFRILFDDTVDYDVDDMFNNLDDGDKCNQLVNSAILGALKKRSEKCANPECTKRFMNISSFHSTIIHWDHTGGKEYEAALINDKGVVVMLNEVGRYLGATCAFCHGEQPKSPEKPRTWE